MDLPFHQQGTFAQPASSSFPTNGIHHHLDTLTANENGQEGSPAASTSNNPSLSIILSVRLLMGGKARFTSALPITLFEFTQNLPNFLSKTVARKSIKLTVLKLND